MTRRKRGWCIISLTAAVLAAAGFGSCIVGCTGHVTPRMEVAYGPVKLVNTKDTDLEINNLKYDPATKGFSLEKMVVRDNASDVMTANVAQMQVMLEMHKVVGQNAQIILGGLTDLAGQLTPLVGALKTTAAQNQQTCDLLSELLSQLQNKESTP